MSANTVPDSHESFKNFAYAKARTEYDQRYQLSEYFE